MKALGLIVNFFVRFLPSFSAIGYRVRSLGWAPLRLDARGQTWLITGASGGLGAAMVIAAAKAGADVIAVARSSDKLEAMRARAGGAGADIELVAMDCASLAELAALAGRLGDRRIDVLVNNVGVMLAEPATTAEGFDKAYATNVLGHFVLTEALLANGTLAGGSMVLSMSSGGMYNVPALPEALDTNPDNYNGTAAYALHKRAQVALTGAWKQRYGTSGVQFLVMHPGWVDTPGVQTSMPTFRRLLAPLLRTAAQGIDTALWLTAMRPVTGPDRIWFDRAARDIHIGNATRAASATDNDVYEQLAADAARTGL